MPVSVVIPPEWRIAALALGAGLCLAAILLGVVWRSAVRTALGKFMRAAAVTAGVLLIIWALASYLPSRSGAPAVTASAHASPAAVSARDLVGTAATALEACTLPSPPPLPNGEQASRDEMATARAAFQAYDAATNTYTGCVDATIARTAQQFAGIASSSDIDTLNTFGARAHNAAIDQEKASVDQFNAQIRTYRAKHPE